MEYSLRVVLGGRGGKVVGRDALEISRSVCMLLSVVCFLGGFGGFGGLWGLLGHWDRFWGSQGKYPIVLVYTPPHGHMNTSAHVRYIIHFSSEIYMCARTRAIAHTCVRIYARKHVYVCPLKKKHTHAPDGLKVDSSGLFQRLRRQFFTKLNPKPEPPRPISQNSKP